MKNRLFVHTDLAMECKSVQEAEEISGVELKKKEEQGIKILDMSITTEQGSEATGKPMGRYLTLTGRRFWLMTDEEKSKMTGLLSEYIRQFCHMTQKTEKREKQRAIMVVGLGNRDVTPDSLGPRVIDGLIVTRHIKDYSTALFDSIGQEEVAAIAPGVVGQTGIETLELIKGAVEHVKPRVVIVIDALAARSTDRLACTLQLSDTGIAPGSGIGNRRREINRHSLGVPVVAVGVPTVVNSSTLVYDALEQAGIGEPENSIKEILENHKSFFVSLKESDVAVREASSIISTALNDSFSVEV